MPRFLSLDPLDLDMFELMPPNMTTHFKPAGGFLDWFLYTFQNDMIFEVGAGQCEFAAFLYTRGMKVLAIEPRPNDKVVRQCASFLLPIAMQKATVLRDCPAVVVVARPDHSGWVEKLLDIVHPQSRIVYIGLPENVDRDLPGRQLSKLYVNAGEDDEIVYEVIR